MGTDSRRGVSGLTAYPVAPSAGDGGDVGEAGDACGHQALGVAGVTQLARISRPPGPDRAVTAQRVVCRTRVPRMRGAFCRDLLPPCSHGKALGSKRAGAKAPALVRLTRFYLKGLTTRPLGEARTRNVFAATARVGRWNRVSRADPHDRGDRGVGTPMAESIATQGQQYGGCCA